MKYLGTAAAAAFLTLASGANAAREIAYYDISYVGDPTRAVDGAVFSARAEVEVYAGGINGVVGLTGYRNGLPVTLLDYGTFPEPGQINQDPNTNLLNTQWPFFTTRGIAFASGALRFLVFYDESGLLFECRGSGPRCTNAIILRDVSVTPVVPDVPEPATWAMIAVGFGLVGAAARRRKVAIAA